MSSNPRVPFRLADEAPRIPAPEGKSLIVHVVVNVEVWRFDQPMPRGILTPPQGVAATPDVPNWSWAEYGNRVGMPRLFRALADRALPATCSINAAVIDTYPRLAERILEAGWEWMGHGVFQRSVKTLPDERAMIAEASERIERFTGTRPRGWLGPGLAETAETPDILKELGYDWVADWVLDDLPAWMSTRHGPMLALPYNLELNDSVIWAVEKHSSGEMHRRTMETLAVFDREMAGNPRVLTLPLHPHLAGVPHRIGWIEKTLDAILERDDAIFMTGSEIADWFRAATQGS
ncbi:MAG: polysaccharide deacetylase family protein [Alphaproteobacteria bacterium]|nr:polysaccharide deacetylase family protein [Alphaproteobacteria bacterium]